MASANLQENKILPLVSLRFFLAMWIFVHHLFPVWMMPLSRRLGEFGTGLFVSGYIAVPFFFMLSGFVLFHAYGSEIRLDNESRKRFWLRRFSRIAPCFYLSLIIGIAPYYGMTLKNVDASFGVFLGTAKDLIIDMLFLGTNSRRALTLNYSGWTISVEAMFYMVFPFIAPLIFRLRKKGLFTVIASCILFGAVLQLVIFHFHPELYSWRASQFRPDHDLGAGETWRYFLLSSPICHFPEFLIGLALARLHSLYGLTRIKADLPLCLCFAGVIAVLYVLPYLPYLFVYNWVLLPVMATMIFLLTSASGRIGIWLSHPKLLLYGEASYVLYILHTPSRDWVSFMMGHFGVRGTYAQYATGAIFAPLFILVSIPLHYKVNIPVTRAIYRYLKKIFLKSEQARNEEIDSARSIPEAQISFLPAQEPERSAENLAA